MKSKSPPVVMTSIVLCAPRGSDIMRLVLIESHNVFGNQPPSAAIVARFAGPCGIQPLSPPERHLIDRGFEWDRERSRILTASRKEWRLVDVRWGIYATRSTFDAALGGPASELLRQDGSDADGFDFVTSRAGPCDMSRAGFAYHWRHAYWEIKNAVSGNGPELRPPLIMDPAQAARVVAPTYPSGPAEAPMVPIYVTTLFSDSKYDARTMRFVLLESEPRTASDGTYGIGAVFALFPGRHTFTKTPGGLDRHEMLQRWWPETRARILRNLEIGWTISGQTTVMAHGRGQLREMLGPRLFKAMGGPACIEFLSPSPKGAGPLLPEPGPAGPVDFGADARRIDDPLFGTF